jgi:hypothetical protein
MLIDFLNKLFRLTLHLAVLHITISTNGSYVSQSKMSKCKEKRLRKHSTENANRESQTGERAAPLCAMLHTFCAETEPLGYQHCNIPLFHQPLKLGLWLK